VLRVDVPRFVVLFFAVPRFMPLFFAVPFFAVPRFVPPRLLVLFPAPLRFAVLFLAPERLLIAGPRRVLFFPALRFVPRPDFLVAIAASPPPGVIVGAARIVRRIAQFPGATTRCAHEENMAARDVDGQREVPACPLPLPHAPLVHAAAQHRPALHR